MPLGYSSMAAFGSDAWTVCCSGVSDGDFCHAASLLLWLFLLGFRPRFAGWHNSQLVRQCGSQFLTAPHLPPKNELEAAPWQRSSTNLHVWQKKSDLHLGRLRSHPHEIQYAVAHGSLQHCTWCQYFSLKTFLRLHDSTWTNYQHERPFSDQKHPVKPGHKKHERNGKSLEIRKLSQGRSHRSQHNSYWSKTNYPSSQWGFEISSRSSPAKTNTWREMSMANNDRSNLCQAKTRSPQAKNSCVL